MLRKVIFLLVGLLLFSSIGKTEETDFSLYGQPYCPGTLLIRQAYMACHNDDLLVPLWVAYKLTAKNLQGTAERSDDFRPDPDLPVGNSAELSDYRGSGYDKGHLVPAADMVQSQEVMSESFLLSNMAPQVPNLNRGIWLRLEEKVRKWAQRKGDVYIIAGSIFLDRQPKTKEIDYWWTGNVAVPSYFFKIIAHRKNDGVEVIAFIMANEKHRRGATVSDYLVAVDEVERLTGLDFFAQLPDPLEALIEAIKWPIWPTP